MLADSQTSRGFRRQAKASSNGLREGTLFDASTCGLPDCVVEPGMGLELRLDRERIDRTLPTAGILQTAARSDEPTRAAQQAFRGIDLGGLNSDEVVADRTTPFAAY